MTKLYIIFEKSYPSKCFLFFLKIIKWVFTLNREANACLHATLRLFWIPIPVLIVWFLFVRDGGWHIGVIAVVRSQSRAAICYASPSFLRFSRLFRQLNIMLAMVAMPARGDSFTTSRIRFERILSDHRQRVGRALGVHSTLSSIARERRKSPVIRE